MKRFLIIIIITQIYGCSGFLEQEPDKQVSIKEQFSTKQGVLMSVNGMYVMIQDIIASKLFYYADLIAGNLTFTPNKNDYIIEIPIQMNISNVYQFKDTQQESEYESVYNNAYKIINACNLIIEKITDVDFLNTDEKNQITAEALTGRALMHFTVSLLYAQQYGFTNDASHLGVVYNTHTLISGVDYPKRKSMKRTWELLQKDMNKALSLYTQKQALDYGADYSYFNATTTKALYARMALQMNDWNKALEFSNTIINQNNISLTSQENYIAEWEKPEAPVSEIILEFSAPRTSEGDVSKSVALMYYYYTNEKKYSPLVASNTLLTAYTKNDIRKNMFVGANLKTSTNDVIKDKTYYFTKKFQDDPGTTFIRLSEMYLISAEANARLGNTDKALADLNTIRIRAGLERLLNSQQILEEIFNERRRELAFEGHLLFDISRFKKDIVRDDDCYANICQLQYPSNYFILPIPELNIKLNENMQQNEGY